MNIVNSDEKEASEVLHSLLSVERRALDIKDEIIVEIPVGAHGDHTQWQTPVLAQHSVFDLADGQHQDYTQDHQTDQDMWQGHTIQITTPGDITDGAELLEGIYNQDHTNTDTSDIEVVEHKPAIGKKRKIKKKKNKQAKNSMNDDDNELLEDDNRSIEDNIQQVTARLEKGCECQVSCYKGLNPENVYKHRLNIAELTKGEHDMYLMGVTMARLANPLETCRHKERVRLRASYVYQGRKVCLEAFLYLENVTHYQLKRIRRHVMMHGVIPRVHGNMGKKPHNTFSLDIYKHATGFMKHYLARYTKNGDGNASSVISRKGGSQNSKVVIYGDSSRGMYDAYKQYGEMLHPGVKLMGFSTFRHFVKEQFPHVRFNPRKPEAKEAMVPFKSGKCMTYDKNKDPVRIEQERNKAEQRKALMEQKRQERKEKEMVAVSVAQQVQVAQVQVPQHHPQQHQIQIQHHQQHQHQQVQPQIIIQQPHQTIQTQVSTHQPQMQQQQQQVQTVQHQIVQQMNVQTVGDDNQSQITQQMIPVAVVQQTQPTYIVTPVSHLQTAAMQGTWYRRH